MNTLSATFQSPERWPPAAGRGGIWKAVTCGQEAFSLVAAQDRLQKTSFWAHLAAHEEGVLHDVCHGSVQAAAACASLGIAERCAATELRLQACMCV